MADENATEAKMVNFTPAETKFLLCALKNVEGGFKVLKLKLRCVTWLLTTLQFNADAVAAELGFKDGNVARVRWNRINRTKIQGGGASPSGGVQKGTPRKKNTPRKANADGNGNGGDDDENTKTPTKKKGRKSKVEAEAKAEGNIKQEEIEDAVETTEKVDE